MLASINPLGERARRNRWWLTATAYVAGSVAGGAALGGLAGAAGALLSAPWRPPARAVAPVAALLCLAAAGSDLTGRRPPSWRRQVNEDWLAVYRGWVYGGGFGVQLGAGVLTIVTTATVYLTFALALLSASAPAGAAVGAAFGLSRALPLAAMAGVDRPEALRRFHARMQAALPAARRAAAAVAVAAGVVVALAGLRGAA